MAYCPTIKTIRQWSDRRKLVEVPLYFLCFCKNKHERVRKSKKVNGVVNFVYYRSKPAKIRDTEIEAIKEFLGKSNQNTIEFVSNEAVSINSGLLAGKKGKVIKVGKNKIILYIVELGAIIKAEISKSMLSKVYRFNFLINRYL